jgi:hypothetical protein
VQGHRAGGGAAQQQVSQGSGGGGGLLLVRCLCWHVCSAFWVSTGVGTGCLPPSCQLTATPLAPPDTLLHTLLRFIDRTLQLSNLPALSGYLFGSGGGASGAFSRWDVDVVGSGYEDLSKQVRGRPHQKGGWLGWLVVCACLVAWLVSVSTLPATCVAMHHTH